MNIYKLAEQYRNGEIGLDEFVYAITPSKVYLVVTGYFEEYSICGATLSLEEAEEEAKKPAGSWTYDILTLNLGEFNT